MSYSCGEGGPPLLGLTVGETLSRSARSFPQREALIVCHQQSRLTYEILENRVKQTAKGLLALGIAKGDRVGIWAFNCEQWVIVQFAAASVGAILVNLNPAYGTRELLFALKQSDIRMLIFQSHFKQSQYVPMLEEICPEIRRCTEGRVRSRALPQLKRLVFLGQGKPFDWLLWDELLSSGEMVAEEAFQNRRAELTCDDPISIQYTSGTTGSPKGVMLSHHSIVNNAYFVGTRMKLTHQDRLCIPVPLFHCFGMVMGSLGAVVAASAMVLPSPTFDALATLHAIQQERCTVVYGVPSMFIAELDHPEFANYDLNSLRTGIMAGAPCPIEVMTRVVGQMNCREMTIAYGQTESAPVITQTSTDDSIERRVSSVGRALPYTEVKIIDPVTGKVMPREQQGELCSRGYLLMKGYYRNSKATRQAIDPDGWLHTGDLATMGQDGYVNITGRARDLIIRGGENVYPREIEEFLYTHPKISDVQVIGVPDSKYGEQVMAWVRLRDGEVITIEELREFCRGKISYFKIPQYLKVVSTYPMTLSGKIQKYKMRQIAIEELGLESAAGIKTV